MADDLYEDRKNNLNFKDSWLQDTVQLAAGAGILLGAGTLAVKGDLTGAVKPAKGAIKRLDKATQNYLKRRGGPLPRFAYDLITKTQGYLKRMPKVDKKHADDFIDRLVIDRDERVQELLSDPTFLKRIDEETARRLPTAMARRRVSDLKNNVNDFNDDLTAQRELERTIYEKTKADLIKRELGDQPQGNKRWNNRNNLPSQQQPLFNKRELANTGVVMGLGGFTWGAGMTAEHAIDRWSKNPDSQQKLEEAYQEFGSWLPKEEEKDSMKKAAGSLELYNALKEIGRKPFDAIGTGLGFTGVSLGTAKLLNDQKEQKDDGSQEGTRVIIELGNQPVVDDKNHANHPSLAGLPKLSGFQEDGFKKMALRAPNWLGNFAKDFKGYDKEINQLRKMNYSDEAAKELKDSDVEKLLNEQYGNLVTPQSEGQFRTRLLDSRADSIKHQSEERAEELERRMARARLQGIGAAGALGATGIGLAGLASRERNELPSG